MSRASTMLRFLVDPSTVMRLAGTPPDPWQTDFLRRAADARNDCNDGPFRGLLLTARQAGKSTTIAALAVWWALVKMRALGSSASVLIVSPTLRQSCEIILKCRHVVQAMGVKLVRDAATFLVLPNGGRIVALAGSGHIRGMTGSLVVVDEAAFLSPTVMTASVLPMLSSIPGGGTLVCASTPAGCQGFFWDWFERGGAEYSRWKVPYTQVPRLTEENVRQLKAAMPASVWAAEMLCEFRESGNGIWLPTLVDCAFVDQAEVPIELPDIPTIDWGAAA